MLFFARALANENQLFVYTLVNAARAADPAVFGRSLIRVTREPFAGAMSEHRSTKRHRGRRHLAGLIAQVLGIAVTELAVPVGAPASNRAVDEERTVGCETGYDPNRDSADVDIWSGKIARMASAFSRISVTELAFRVVAPAADPAGIEQHADMAAPRRDLNSGSTDWNVRRRHLAGLVGTVVRVP